jgi:hypothetical protein
VLFVCAFGCWSRSLSSGAWTKRDFTCPTGTATHSREEQYSPSKLVMTHNRDEHCFNICTRAYFSDSYLYTTLDRKVTMPPLIPCELRKPMHIPRYHGGSLRYTLSTPYNACHVPCLASENKPSYNTHTHDLPLWPQYTVAPPERLDSLFVKQYLPHPKLRSLMRLVQEALVVALGFRIVTDIALRLFFSRSDRAVVQIIVVIIFGGFALVIRQDRIMRDIP